MKTAILFLILIVTFNVSLAQKNNFSFYNFNIQESTKVQLKNHFNLSSFFGFKYSTQFGGLFQKSFNSSGLPFKWQYLFSDYDLGLNLRLNLNLINQLKLYTSYNIGVLKFNSNTVGNAPAYVFKVSIAYIL